MQNITFASTGGWTTWNEMNVPISLVAGTGNTIRFESNGQDTGNIDQITVTPGGTPPPPPPPAGGVLQAEDAVLAGGVTIDTDREGYNGTGFLNFPVTGGSAQFNSVNGGTGGSKTIAIRFANGASAGSRTGRILVNGVAQNIMFTSDLNWTNWRTLNVTTTLNASTANTIRLESTGQDLANIDQITIP